MVLTVNAANKNSYSSKTAKTKLGSPAHQ